MKLLFVQESPMYEALGIHCISAAAKAAGHDCDVIIESHHRNVHDEIAQARPDLIAFSFMTRQHEWGIRRIAELKREFDIPILVGGTHPTMYPETLEHSEADFLCVGEGEIPTVELLTRMEQHGRTDDIPNIHAKVDGKVVKNEIRPLMTSWDAMPLPDRDVYRRYPFLQELPLKRFITSFGCAYKCSFCYINNYREIYSGKGKFFRRKTIERALAEIKATQDRYPLRRIHFVDDIFSLDRSWVEKFLPRLKMEIDVPFSANIWISHMNESMVQLFKETGCAGLTFGVESGNEENRINLMDKNLPNAVYIKHCGHLRKYKIPFHTGNIIGAPGEGLDKAYETARFNRAIGTTSARAGLFWPFPGTRLTEYAMERGMLESDYSSRLINSAEFINKGLYARVKHEQADELLVMANLFQAVAKWRWFDPVSRMLLKRPRNPLVKAIAKVVEASFWYAEARFFGLLNRSGLRYYWHLRKAIRNMRVQWRPYRMREDVAAQRPFWSVSRRDVAGVYASGKARDGLT